MKWLTDEELASWLAVVRLMTWLPWSIDQQLQRDSNLAMVEYQVLAMLSNSPQWTMRMSSLAEVTNASLSRLSHVVKRLETPGPGLPATRSHRRTVHQRHPHGRRVSDDCRRRPQPRGARAVRGRRCAVA